MSKRTSLPKPVFDSVPDIHSMVPRNIRRLAADKRKIVHAGWNDALLLSLWDICLHDVSLILDSVDLPPHELFAVPHVKQSKFIHVDKLPDFATA